ncbi:hypothetical protein VTN02DRAFT_6509 [Thermoascus thermophilus]
MVLCDMLLEKMTISNYKAVTDSSAVTVDLGVITGMRYLTFDEQKDLLDAVERYGPQYSQCWLNRAQMPVYPKP